MTSKFIAISFMLVFNLQALAKTFVYCSEGSPTAFNPQVTTDGTSNNAATHTIYNRLVEFKYGTTEVIPALATSWTISKDQLTYTFKLRKGVKFHATKYFKPTRDFSADDVIFSINRQRIKDHPYHKVGGQTFDYFSGMNMQNIIKDVKKVDNHTVQIVLAKKEAPFLADMAMGFMSILSKEYADKLALKGKKEQIDFKPVGTGPFVFKKYVRDSLIRYTANKDYWEGQSKIKKLVFSISTNPNVRHQKLKTGECHLAIEPPPADIPAIKNNKKLKTLEAEGLNVGYLAFNTSKRPFNNKLVRKAVALALDRESYIKAIYLGNASVANGPLPPTIWGHAKLKKISQNLEEAKKLLAKAGYKNGFETELWTLPVSRPYNPDGRKMGEMMQADLAKIGIKLKLITYDWATYLKKSRKGDHQLIQLGWTGDNGDPDNFLHVLLGCTAIKAGSNVARWCNKEFNALIEKAKTISSHKKRVELYKKAQKVFERELPWVPIAHAKVFRAMNKKVQGYKIDVLGGDIFKTVSLE